MIDEEIKIAREKMDKVVHNVQKEMAQIRTGKATVALLDSIKVESYGQVMPLNQLASISTPEVRLLAVQPWDKAVIPAIEKAILKSDLGLNPTSDGSLIRIAIPQLTEERRKALVKLVKNFGEEGKIALRNIRREINDKFKKMQKIKQIREDELYRAQENSQKATDEEVKKIDDLVELKEKEVMQV